MMRILALAAAAALASISMPAMAAVMVNVTNINTTGPSAKMRFDNGDVVLAVAQRLTLSNGDIFDVFCIEPFETALHGTVNLNFEVMPISQYGSFANVQALAGFARWGLDPVGPRSPVGQYGVVSFGVGGVAFDGDFASNLTLSNGATSALVEMFQNRSYWFNLDGVYAWRETSGRGQNYVGIRLPDVSTAVPEPASWAMMIIGFGAVGFAARRERGRLPAHVTA